MGRKNGRGGGEGRGGTEHPKSTRWAERTGEGEGRGGGGALSTRRAQGEQKEHPTSQPSFRVRNRSHGICKSVLEVLLVKSCMQ